MNKDNFNESKYKARKIKMLYSISPLVLPSRVVRGVCPCFLETEEQLELDNIKDGYGGIRKPALEDSYGWMLDNRSRLYMGKYTIEI